MRFPYILIVLLFLLLMITAGVVTPAMVKLKPVDVDMQAYLSERAGFAVSIDRPVQFRVLPRPQLIVSNLAGSSDGSVVQKIIVPRLVINIDPLKLIRQRLQISGLILLNAQAELAFHDGPDAFISGWLERAHPNIQIINGSFKITGLNRFKPVQEAMFEGVSGQLPARGAGAPFSLQLSRQAANGYQMLFKMRLDNVLSLRKRVSSQLTFGPNEKLTFDGFLRGARSHWRMDGEVGLTSGALVAELIEMRLPVRLTQAARRVSFAGLVRIDRTGLQTQNLEISLFDTLFQSRLQLNWPTKAGQTPVLTGRLSTGAVNLDLADWRFNGDTIQASDIDSLWRVFAPQPAVALRVEATRYDLGGESGRDLVVAFDWRDGLVNVERVSLELPFRSLLLASGDINLRGARPSFTGSFSTRSSDALAALVWLGDRFDVDLSAPVEALDESRLQRFSLVGDIDLSAERFHVTKLAGRLGDDRVSADILLHSRQDERHADRQEPSGRVAVNFERFDLAEWGLLEAGASARVSAADSVFAPLNRLLATKLAEPNDKRRIEVEFATDRLFSGATDFGPTAISARLVDRELTFSNIRFDDFNGVTVIAKGALSYDAPQPYGRLQLALRSDASTGFAGPLLQRLAPIPINAGLPLDIEADWRLTAPNSTDWPNVLLTGKGFYGGFNLAFDMSTPARELAFGAAGSRLRVALNGDANRLADMMRLPPQYQNAQSAALLLNLEAQNNNVSSLDAQLTLADDRLGIIGVVRPGSGGARVEGSLSFALANSLPLFVSGFKQASVPLIGNAQINASTEQVSFNALQASIGDGQVSGEGVLSLADARPRLNANLALRRTDLSRLLPRFDETGWSQAPMRWSALGYGNAEIELRAEALRLGALLFEEATAQIKLTEGVLEVPQISARLLRGTLQARLQAEGGNLNPFFNLESEFSGLQPADFLLGLYGDQLLEAPVDGTLTLLGRGTSAAAMLGSLNGDMRLEIGPGMLTFVDLNGFADAVLKADFAGQADDLLQQGALPGKTRFERGVALLQARDGQVRRITSDFVFAPPRTDGRLNGVFDFVSRQLEAEMNLFPVGRDKPVRWVLSGDIVQPKIERDAGAFDKITP